MPGMNTHFDIATEQQRKRAEALKPLSLEPALHNAQPPRPMFRRLVLPVCLAALIAGAGASALFYRPDVVRRIETALPEPEHATAGPVAIVQAGGERSAVHNPVPASREITGSGFVVAPSTTTVFAKYEGRITQIAVAPGDPVVKGQALVLLEDAGAGFALEEARAKKVQAELVLTARDIDLTQARTLLDRAETLAARNATPKQALEDAHAAAERASNAVAQAQQSSANADLAIRIAGERVAELTVRAPFDSTVTRLDARIGDTVLARIDSVRESQSLLMVTDTKNLVIDADVAETSIAPLKPGLGGQAVLDAFPDQPFAVTVLRLAPIASAEKGTVALRLSFTDPPDGIRPNMAARIRIVLEETGDPTQ